MPVSHDALRELVDLHRENAIADHRRLRVDLTERSNRCDAYEEATDTRVRHLEREMTRMEEHIAQRSLISARQAVILASVLAAGINGIVTLVVYFWR